MTDENRAGLIVLGVLLLYLVGHHCWRRWHYLSFAFPVPLRAALVAKDGIILALLLSALASGPYLVFSHEPIAATWFAVMAMAVGRELAPLAGVSVHLTRRGKMAPLRFQTPSTQILLNRAYIRSVADEWNDLEYLADIYQNAPKRAALIARYLDEVEPGKWIPISRQDSIIHEDFYKQGPIARFAWFIALGTFVGFMLVGFQARHPDLEVIRLLHILSFFIFGAGIIDGNISFVVLGVIGSCLMFWIIPFRRVILTATVAGYVGFSLYQLPIYDAQLNRLPMVRSFLAMEDRVREAERRARELAQVPLIGSDLARMAREAIPRDVMASAEAAVAVKFLSKLSPKAVLGFSVVSWGLLTWMVLYHLWFTDAGAVRFAHKIRRPTIFGPPTPLGSSLIASREKPVGMDSIPAP